MTDKQWADVLVKAAERRRWIEDAIKNLRPLPGESTDADERHYAEGCAYACGYYD